MREPRFRIVVLILATVAAALAAVGCDSAKKKLDEARTVEASGDLAGAIAAYEAIEEAHPHGRTSDDAREAAQAVRQVLAEVAVADGAPGFDLPESCEVGEILSVGPASAGARVEISLRCADLKATTAGRVISADKVWDLDPVSGVLEDEGNCVFRSHGNPLGDWALQVPAEECHTQQQLRQGTLDRLGHGGGNASFECDCRLGEARFEIPRGEPGWRKPPTVYTDKEGRVVDPPL